MDGRYVSWPASCWPPALAPASSEGEAVDMIDLIWKVLLALLSQEAEACGADDPADHLQVAAHTAVHIVQDHALLGHVVFDDDDAIGAQAPLAAAQKLRQVLICQVAWGGQRHDRKTYLVSKEARVLTSPAQKQSQKLGFNLTGPPSPA